MTNGYLQIALSTAFEALPFAGKSIYVNTDGFVYNKETSLYTNDIVVDEQHFTHRLITDESGKTEALAVSAPNEAASQKEQDTVAPYAVSDVYVDVAGYYPVRVNRVQIFAGQISILPIVLSPVSPSFDASTVRGVQNILIPPPTLRFPTVRGEDYPFPGEERFRPQILEKVVVPAYVSVHLGAPAAEAENIYVSFADYVKNVASSEIYPTWEREALKANILAIMSITLNRIFTEWYPSQGFSFDITNNTAYDQSFVPGRNYFDSISQIVDDTVGSYIIRQNYINPLYAAYCDGVKSDCSGMKQWGSQSLAEEGYSTTDILRFYYGSDIQIASTDNIGGAVSSFPGQSLQVGDSSNDVQTIRRELYRVADNYPEIPKVNPAYLLFDKTLESAVKIFQQIFNLEPTGVVDYATWYRISFVYVSVTKLAELTAYGETGGLPLTPPNVVLSFGESGRFVLELQYMLNYLSLFYVNMTPLELDGYYGVKTREAVETFQGNYRLEKTGRMQQQDWETLFDAYYTVLKNVTPSLGEQAYPGYVIKIGDSGEAVRLMQSYLDRIATRYEGVPSVEADGVFGEKTREAVTAFQKAFFLRETGEIDALTWERIVEIYNYTVKF